MEREKGIAPVKKFGNKCYAAHTTHLPPPFQILVNIWELMSRAVDSAALIDISSHFLTGSGGGGGADRSLSLIGGS